MSLARSGLLTTFTVTGGGLVTHVIITKKGVQ
jgi:hypothetical protein